jgi:hypothetical protein
MMIFLCCCGRLSCVLVVVFVVRMTTFLPLSSSGFDIFLGFCWGDDTSHDPKPLYVSITTVLDIMCMDESISQSKVGPMDHSGFWDYSSVITRLRSPLLQTRLQQRLLYSSFVIGNRRPGKLLIERKMIKLAIPISILTSIGDKCLQVSNFFLMCYQQTPLCIASLLD